VVEQMTGDLAGNLHPHRRRLCHDGIDRATALSASPARVMISRDTVGRVRCHRAEHLGLGTDYRDVRDGVAAEGDRDRQVQHDLPRIMGCERFAPPPAQP
jgi:hypothetical protein